MKTRSCHWSLRKHMLTLDMPKPCRKVGYLKPSPERNAQYAQPLIVLASSSSSAQPRPISLLVQLFGPLTRLLLARRLAQVLRHYWAEVGLVVFRGSDVLVLIVARMGRGSRVAGLLRDLVSQVWSSCQHASSSL